MREFVLIFRRDFQSRDNQPTEEEIRTYLVNWREWFGKLNECNQLIRSIQRIDPEGRILRAGGQVSSGPYTEVRESIGGIVMLNASGYEEVISIIESCPLLTMGVNIEIRMNG